jgi:hypothetical protein
MRILRFSIIIFILCSVLLINVDIKPNLENFGQSSDCASILVQVSSNEYVSGFRRDSVYPTDLFIKKTVINGIEAIRECYNNSNGYFTHSLIFANGWYMGIGGSESTSENNELESLGCEIVKEGDFNQDVIMKIEDLINTFNLCHFLLKAPDGQIITYEKKDGKTKNMIFKLQDNEYVVVPNGPDYYQNGIWTNSTPSVDSIIYLGSTDEYGVNRRNIISYHVSNEDTVTDIEVYASHDDGSLSAKPSSGKDNIIFENRFISNDTIPEIPKKIAIGNIKLFNNKKHDKEHNQIINDLKKNNDNDLNRVNLEKSGNPIPISLLILLIAIVLLNRKKT